MQDPDYQLPQYGNQLPGSNQNQQHQTLPDPNS